MNNNEIKFFKKYMVFLSKYFEKDHISVEKQINKKRR